MKYVQAARLAAKVAKAAAVRIITGQSSTPVEKVIEVAVKQLVLMGIAMVTRRMGFPPEEAAAT